MKKIVLILLFGFALVAVFVVVSITKKPQTTATANTDFLRIHIRANSNSESDQNVKYKVKEKVVEYLSPLIVSCPSMEDAKQIVQSNLANICEIANSVLLANGFDYGSKAEVRVEEFPTRSYGSLTLDAGWYFALILELGTGNGDNWWCVMFPPLCFACKEGNNSGLKYESIIWNLIKKY